jgi:hypothetical protein
VQEGEGGFQLPSQEAAGNALAVAGVIAWGGATEAAGGGQEREEGGGVGALSRNIALHSSDCH